MTIKKAEEETAEGYKQELEQLILNQGFSDNEAQAVCSWVKENAYNLMILRIKNFSS
jgi:hypothetical protein